jgi:hypothetical protein
MKNQFFGDINDYRKYGLLRLLAGGGGMKIGICWMLTADDGAPGGKLTGYLKNPTRWEKHDCGLFWRLREAVLVKQQRNVAQVRIMGILSAVKSHELHLTDKPSVRDRYFKRAFKKLLKVDLIFFDPDNGLEVKSSPRGTKDSSKYLYWKEVRQGFEELGKSLLIYQHFPPENRQRFIVRKREEIKTHTEAQDIHAFKTPRVAFFLAVQPKHSEYFQRRIEELERSSWHAEKQIVVCRDEGERR